MSGEQKRFLFLVIFSVIAGLIMASIGCEPPKPAKAPCCPQACPEKPAIGVLWFSATWCGPCKRQAPEARAAVLGYTWKEIDIDDDPALARQYQIRAVPTYLVLVNGKERARTNDARELRRLLGR